MGVYITNTGLNDFLLIETSADFLVQASAFSTFILNAMPRHLDAEELIMMLSLRNAKKIPAQIQRVLLGVSLYMCASV